MLPVYANTYTASQFFYKGQTNLLQVSAFVMTKAGFWNERNLVGSHSWHVSNLSVKLASSFSLCYDKGWILE